MRIKVLIIALIAALMAFTVASHAQERKAAPPAPAKATAPKGLQTARGAVQNAPSAVANSSAPDEMKIEKQAYIYNASGRRDPLLSIIIASKEAEKKKSRPKTKFVPPIEDYDVSQFKLIAIIWNNKEESYALVGLPDGKYYNLKEGMRAGVNDGKVMRITPDSVVVREFMKDYRGKLVAKDTALKLRKEEGK